MNPDYGYIVNGVIHPFADGLVRAAVQAECDKENALIAQMEAEGVEIP